MVIELKRGKATHEGVHQLSRYVQKVRALQTTPTTVWGILVAPDATRPALKQLIEEGLEYRQLTALPQLARGAAGKFVLNSGGCGEHVHGSFCLRFRLGRLEGRLSFHDLEVVVTNLRDITSFARDNDSRYPLFDPSLSVNSRPVQRITS